MDGFWILYVAILLLPAMIMAFAKRPGAAIIYAVLSMFVVFNLLLWPALLLVSMIHATLAEKSDRKEERRQREHAEIVAALSSKSGSASEAGQRAVAAALRDL